MSANHNSKEEMYFTSGKDVSVDAEYGLWLDEIKNRFNQARLKATIVVNAEKLRWNWELGRDLVIKKAEEHWGAGVVEQLSLDLRASFPDEKGFGASNLWYMKKWYGFYSEKLHQVGGELRKFLCGPNEEPNTQADGMEFPELFAMIPWRHHVEIITRCDTIEQALFYINKTIENGFSRAELINCIKANLFLAQGGAVTNFTDQLPEAQAEWAQEMTKENYDFGFITLPPPKNIERSS